MSMKTNARRVRTAGRSLRAEPLEPRALLASFEVTDLGDSGPGTLRDAIERANLDPAADTISFARRVRGQITLASPLPDLATDLSILGPGPGPLAVARPTDAGLPAFRIFTVAAGASVEITNLTISGGQTEVGGGGISNAGTLVVSLATLRENSGYSQTDFIFSSGGAIQNTGTLTVRDSTFDQNGVGAARGFSASYGGAIYNTGTMTVVGSTFDQNGAGGMTSSGGAIYNAGTATIGTSTFNANVASGGGRYGGQGYGGAIANVGTLDVESCTFADNRIGGTSTRTGGGGIINRAASARILVGASLFSENFGGSIVNESGTFSSQGHNLFSDSPSLALSLFELVNTDPLLGPLADNGGPTRTRALLPGSPAIDAGIQSANVATDQRGVVRPQGVIPDVGAFESRGFTIAVAGGTPQSTTVGSPFPAALTVAVASPFGEPVAGGRVSFTAPQVGASAVLSAGSAPIDPSGYAQVRAAANGTLGTYAVVARLALDPGVGFALNNTAPATVVGFKRVTPRRRPTLLTLTFGDPLHPTRAADRANYALVDLGPDRKPGSRDDRRVKVRAAGYDPAANTVTLTISTRLSPSRTYQLTAVATPPGGLTDRAGTPIDGNGDGQPGGDYVTKFRGPRPT